MLEFEKFAQTVERFTRKGVETEDFETDIGTATLRYVKNGDPEFKSAINGMFGFDEVYTEYPGDFILFYIKGELQAIGTYTPAYGAAIEVEEVEDMINVFWSELLAVIQKSSQ